MTESGNRITGGTFSGITTVGNNTTVNHSTDGGVDATVRLARDLLALIDQHAASLERPEPARRDAAEVAEELALPTEEQDQDRLSDTLKRLAGRVRSVSALAEATKKLTDLVFS